MQDQQFIIYDERALSGSTDDASVLETASSLSEGRHKARRLAADFGDVALYQYDVEWRGGHANLANEKGPIPFREGAAS